MDFTKKLTKEETIELLKMSDWVHGYFWYSHWVILPLLTLSIGLMITGMVLTYGVDARYVSFAWIGMIISLPTQVAYWSMNHSLKKKKKRTAQILGVPEDWRIK